MEITRVQAHVNTMPVPMHIGTLTEKGAKGDKAIGKNKQKGTKGDKSPGAQVRKGKKWNRPRTQTETLSAVISRKDCRYFVKDVEKAKSKKTVAACQSLLTRELENDRWSADLGGQPEYILAMRSSAHECNINFI